MSGHSKWSTIKRKKAVTDAKKGQSFTKISRLVTLAVRSGGKDPESNSALRLALVKAREVNMPNQVVDRAIEKGAGAEGLALEQIVLEGYGPEGIAVLIEGVTDNRNRTVSEVRTVFNRHEGSLGEVGSSAYIFKDRENPSFTLPLEEAKREKVLNLLEALDELDDVQEIYTNLEDGSSNLETREDT